MMNIAQLRQRALYFQPIRLFATQPDLPTLFENYLKKARVETDRPIIIGKNTFEQLVTKMQTAEDVKTVLGAYCTIIGHRNLLPQTHTDMFLNKALQIQAPQAAFDMIKFHEQLMVHPHHRVIARYLDHFVNGGDYSQLKAFF